MKCINILSDLQGQILCRVYHVRRLKKAQLKTPIGNVTTYDELKTTFQESNTNSHSTLPNISDAALAQSLVTNVVTNVHLYITALVLNICVHVVFYKCFIADICEVSAITQQ